MCTTDFYALITFLLRFALTIHAVCNAKMAIRLLKNVKSDMDEEISLSSYDIASLMFHCPDNLIQRYVARDLSISQATHNPLTLCFWTPPSLTREYHWKPPAHNWLLVPV